MVKVIAAAAKPCLAQPWAGLTLLVILGLAFNRVAGEFRQRADDV